MRRESTFEGRQIIPSWRDRATSAGQVARFIWYLDTDECEIDEVLRGLTDLHEVQGRRPAAEFTRHIDPGDLPQVMLAVSDAVESGHPYAAEFRFVKPSGEVIWLAAQGEVSTTETGERVLVGVNLDVTAQQIALERANLVAHEMNHRVKNILAIVSSIFRATARGAEDVDALRGAFLTRLDALTALNDVVLRSGGDAADLSTLVASVLRPATQDKLRVDIAPMALNGSAAQTVALVLGELMTNAIKYGGLAEKGEGVALQIATDGEVMRLSWIETAGYPVQAPTKTNGFGMKVLTALTAATFSGRPTLTWRPTGLAFTCEWPAALMAAAPVPAPAD